MKKLIALLLCLTALAGCAAPKAAPSAAATTAGATTTTTAVATTAEATTAAATTATSPGVAPQEIGEGQTTFTFEATDDQKTVTTWLVHTDEKTVGAALLAVGLIQGTTGQYGLMVSQVNGTTADYDADKAYWAFYVDGEYATAGVDATNIEPGKTYCFVYTKE